MEFVLTQKQQEANRLLGSKTARHILLRGGSRSGKSVVIMRRIIARAIAAPGSRHACFRRYLTSARATLWKLTFRDVMKKCYPGLLERCALNETDLVCTLPNGSTIMFGGLDDDARVEKILGFEFVTIFVNEISEVQWSSVSTLLTRLAQKVELLDRPGEFQPPKFFADMNPNGQAHFSYQLFVLKLKPGTSEPVANPDNYAEMLINPADNAANIDKDYLESLGEMSSRDRRRFLDGLWSADVDGALFTSEHIDRYRVTEAPDLIRVVVAVDPAASSGANADMTGIVVAGLAEDGRVYVLADRSLRDTPEKWARAVIAAYDEFDADRVVAEKNNGGEMIEALLRTADANVSYKPLWSSRGKVSRAEPVSSLYERGLVSHVGDLAELESQLCSMTAGATLKSLGYSPDRADALVFAVTELLLGRAPARVSLLAVGGT